MGQLFGMWAFLLLLLNRTHKFEFPQVCPREPGVPYGEWPGFKLAIHPPDEFDAVGGERGVRVPVRRRHVRSPPPHTSRRSPSTPFLRGLRDGLREVVCSPIYVVVRSGGVQVCTGIRILGL